MSRPTFVYLEDMKIPCLVKVNYSPYELSDGIIYGFGELILPVSNKECWRILELGSVYLYEKLLSEDYVSKTIKKTLQHTIQVYLDRTIPEKISLTSYLLKINKLAKSALIKQ